MALRYKISLLTIVAVLVVLIPLSLIHIRSLAEAEVEEIQRRLRSIGNVMATQLFSSELRTESESLQYIFLKKLQERDEDILFAAVYPEGVAVLNRMLFPGSVKGTEDRDLIDRFVKQKSDPTVEYVSVNLPQNRELFFGYSTVGIDQRRRQRQFQAFGWALGLTFLAMIGSIFFARRLTRPIRDLTAGMSRVAGGDLEVRLKRISRDEIGALTRDFNQMVADLQENVLERQRMGHELEIASDIQRKLLPQSEPEVKGLDVAGICLTCSEVGGDYYDYLLLDDGRLAVVIGDVAGHGVPSGLLAAAVQGCLRNQVSIDPSTKVVLAAVDQVVRSSGKQLMTLCYTVIDPRNGLVDTASAGHWSPLHYMERTGAVEDVFPSIGAAPALGTFVIKLYPNHQVSLEPGDVLVFYSDGILEAANPEDEMYGEERLQDALRRHAKGTAQQIRDAILDEVSHFRGEVPQEDDIALVIVKYIPSE